MPTIRAKQGRGAQLPQSQQRDSQRALQWSLCVMLKQDRKRVQGLPKYGTYEEADAALWKYDPECRNEIRRNLYFIQREFAR